MEKTAEMRELLKAEADPARAVGAARYFQARPGAYGEGDVFWGVSVPVQRKISRVWARELTVEQIDSLLDHEVHELRLTSLMALVLRFQKSKSSSEKQKIVDLYLAHTQRINNWDLVDSSAHQILGTWLLDKDWNILIELAKSGDLWKQRIAIIATHAFIRSRQFVPTQKIAVLLLDHPHDLIHKAVGWMLRELGNLDQEAECRFLNQTYKRMPRTMLRYAIEKFPEALRQDYLKGRV